MSRNDKFLTAATVILVAGVITGSYLSGVIGCFLTIGVMIAGLPKR